MYFDDDEGGMVPSGPTFISTTKERVPTSQHAIMSSAMLNAKRARMKVEADRQILANRIARLQTEEMKAVKRIEETHRRTHEILSVKNRQQRTELEKRAQRVAQEEELEMHRAALIEAKAQQRYAVMAARQATAIARQSQAQSNKQAAAHRALAIAQVRGDEYNHAVFKRNVVRQMEAEARDRKMREKQLMVQQMTLAAEQRRRNEEEQITQGDERLSQLEREELELIESLQRCQEEQRSAYAEIDEALTAEGSSALEVASLLQSRAPLR